jgi:hypothetical protein
VERSNSSTQRVGNFKITSGISTDPRTLLNCHLEVGNGNEYPEIHYTPNADITRVYRDVLRYSHGNNDYQGGTLLNRSNYKSIFPFLYFDLTKQKMDIKDGTTKISFRYELSGTTATPYGVYALTLHEHEVELLQKDGKLLLR